MSNSTVRFPNPHELDRIPGTEGWQRMYAYQQQFVTDDPVRKAYEEESFWFQNSMHWPDPMLPFDNIFFESAFFSLSQYNTRIFVLPPVRGIDTRIVNGYVYLAPVAVQNPVEIRERVRHFLERGGYYYEHWHEIEAKWERKMRGLIAELEAIGIPALPAIDDKRIVTDAIGESTGYRLIKAYDTLLDLAVRCWQYHFEMLNLGYAAYVTFMEHCQNLWPNIPTQRVTQMVAGIDVVLFRPDEELKKLARKAVDLGVAEAVRFSPRFTEVRQGLERSAAGRQWLQAWEAARYPWFHISTGTGFYHYHKSWNDDLDVPLSSVCIYIDRILRGESIERRLDDVARERDRIIDEYRCLIEDPDQRHAFDQLRQIAATVFPFVENHQFYVEHWFHSVFWNKIREVAALLVEHGFIAEVEDVWYLKRAEIKDALWDLVNAWASGVTPRGPGVWPQEIEWRQGVLAKFREWSAPPALGVAPEIIQEPLTVLLWGVTNDSLQNWAAAQALETGAGHRKFKGFPGSPGTVEGRARVCRSIAEIAQLEEGEILVAQTTSPSWAPVFNKIRACVTDVGGAMSHAAIVCREYGLPAVVGTGCATRVVKTGEKIRVCGTTGQISVVD
ncbi:MAG: PEP-utilizing enzyme, mobile region [Gammaproteobacteria bacterium]|nr:PEP-utilizing enzyme, mobile region [Gammaproteobacteria bacterium]